MEVYILQMYLSFHDFPTLDFGRFYGKISHHEYLETVHSISRDLVRGITTGIRVDPIYLDTEKQQVVSDRSTRDI